MKVSALIAAALLVVSVSAQAHNHEEKAGMAKGGKAAKTTTPATTTTTTTTTGTGEAHPHDDHHMDCKSLKGKAKKACMKHEKTAHATTPKHTHPADTTHDEAHTH